MQFVRLRVPGSGLASTGVQARFWLNMFCPRLYRLQTPIAAHPLICVLRLRSAFVLGHAILNMIWEPYCQNWLLNCQVALFVVAW